MSAVTANDPSPPPPIVRLAQTADRQALHALVREAGVFSREEIACAIELIDEGLDHPKPDGYLLLVAVRPDSGGIIGYVCYGSVMFTQAACDLFWIATHPDHRRAGAARALVTAMEADLRQRGIEHVRLETSGTGGYSAARAFYDRCGYSNIARIPDFYKPGDDMYIFYKRLAAA